MLKLLFLIALPCTAFSQAINLPKPGPAKLDGATVCLTVPVASRVRDSLAALPLVRKEAKHLRHALGQYRQAADSAHEAYVRAAQANLNLQLVLREEKVETARYEVRAKQWREKARRRGAWNWLAGAAVLVVGAFSVVTR